MDRSGARDLTRLRDIDERRIPRDLDQLPQRGFPRPVTERYALPELDPRDPDMVRGLLRQGHGAAYGQLFCNEERRYRGAICTLHQRSSVSSRSIVQPWAFKAASILSRSSVRIPLRIA